MDETHGPQRRSRLKRLSRLPSPDGGFAKKVVLLGLLNACVLSAASINNIALENIGLNSLVYTSALLTVGEFIANALIFMFVTQMPRKRWLKIFHVATFFLASALFINSYFQLSSRMRLFNMFVSFLLKISLKMTTILTMLFAGSP